MFEEEERRQGVERSREEINVKKGKKLSLSSFFFLRKRGIKDMERGLGGREM